MRKRMAEGNDTLTMAQVHALRSIAECDGMTMKQLASAMMITSPSATSFVERLVEMGWVERYTNAKNRKEVHLRLTRSGAEMLAAKKAQCDATVAALLSHLSPADRSELARLMHLLVAAAEASSPRAL